MKARDWLQIAVDNGTLEGVVIEGKEVKVSNAAVETLLREKAGLAAQIKTAKQRLDIAQKSYDEVAAKEAVFDNALALLGYKSDKVLRTLTVPSSSDWTKEYKIDIYSNGKATCNCESFKFGKIACKHIRSRGYARHDS